MNVVERLRELVEAMPEDRAREVLDFAEFLQQRQECDDWRRSGLNHFAAAFGEDEPEYTLADSPST